MFFRTKQIVYISGATINLGSSGLRQKYKTYIGFIVKLLAILSNGIYYIFCTYLTKAMVRSRGLQEGGLQVTGRRMVGTLDD